MKRKQNKERNEKGWGGSERKTQEEDKRWMEKDRKKFNSIQFNSMCSSQHREDPCVTVLCP